MNQSLYGYGQHSFFVATRAMPCPYIAGMMERKVVTDLDVSDAGRLYELLSRAGFRRSHGLAYRPACPGCNACIPVRIEAKIFKPGRSFRRILNANEDLEAREVETVATTDQYRLFVRYQNTRHGDGEMSSMSFRDYRAMVENSPIDTGLIELRDPDGKLVGTMLADRQLDALSAVYSFFDPDMKRRSLGTYMVLWLIEQACALDLPYVYIGYWIPGSPKMAYKARFQPLQGLGSNGWKQVSD